jgi:hypothetical protein
MSLNYAAILKDLLTWATAAKVAIGAFGTKVWQWIKAEFAKAEADAKAAAAKIEADAKKL